MMVFEHDFKLYPELRNNQLAEFQFQSPHKQIIEDFRAKVVKVHDGDTVTLRTNFRDFDFPFRIVEIDTPELGEGGEEAAEWLNARLLNEDVNIIMDPDERVEKWGRLLGKIFHGGLDIGQEEMNLGLAKEYEKRKEGKIIDPIKDLPWL